jgi:hypothetical protein
MSKEQGWIETLWVILLYVVVGSFSITLSISLALGGLGVVRRGGEFILLQGMARREVDQSIGLLFYLATWLSFTAVVAAISLTAAVFIRNTSLRLEEVFDTSCGAEIRSRLTLFSLVASLLPILAVLLRAVL